MKGRQIGIFNINGEFFALGDRCPHEGGSLCKGKIRLIKSNPGIIGWRGSGNLCAVHGTGGNSTSAPGNPSATPETSRIRQYNVTLEPGETLAKGPYVAETFPVSVEEDYLVVET